MSVETNGEHKRLEAARTEIRILDAMDQPIKMTPLAGIVGVSMPTLRYALRRLKAAGVVVQEHRFWSISI